MGLPILLRGAYHQTDGIREAGKLAGIEIDAFIPEPAAAAYRLLEEKQHRVSQNDLIGVIDMGGGTTDCSVHQWKQGLLNTVVGATGDGLLGGDNITGEIFKYFVQLLKLKIEECFDPDTRAELSASIVEHGKETSSSDRTLAGCNGCERASFD